MEDFDSSGGPFIATQSGIVIDRVVYIPKIVTYEFGYSLGWKRSCAKMSIHNSTNGSNEILEHTAALRGPANGCRSTAPILRVGLYCYWSRPPAFF